MRRLTLADFDYAHPEDLVAQEPPADRDGARLLVRTSDGKRSHRRILDLTSEIPPGALLIFNDSRVFPSRMRASLTTGGGVEIFLLERAGERAWRALARPMKKLKVGTKVSLGAISATVVAREEAAVIVSFDVDDAALYEFLDREGIIPLPPYIKRETIEPAGVSRDRLRYQTVYASERGSVAAPTAGLHFSERLLGELRAKGIETRFLALHVGAGTFLPVKTDDPDAHQMHAEPFCVPRTTVDAIVRAKREGRPVIPVGTTSFRSLEQLAALGPDWRANADQWHETRLYVHPRTAEERFVPQIADGLITNFHQPKSTLFMLIAALIGLESAQETYAEAVRERYRLFSYGDACLFFFSMTRTSS